MGEGSRSKVLRLALRGAPSPYLGPLRGPNPQGEGTYLLAIAAPPRRYRIINPLPLPSPRRPGPPAHPANGGVTVLTWWNKLGLQARFMLTTSIGLLGVAVCVMLLVGWFEVSQVEANLRNASENELKSLNALVSSAMEQRADDKQNVALKVFNRWFEDRNADYPGKLWSAWSPQMASFMAA